MNKEHFLVELKIYLKSLSPKQQMTILDKYDQLFCERINLGETEEQIAKDLGKPKLIAEDILNEFDIKVPEKRMVHDGWKEIYPQKDVQEEFDYGTYYNPESDSEYPYEEPKLSYRNAHSPFVRFCQIVGILCLNFFLMIWLIFSMLMVCLAFWITAGAFILSPIIGTYSVLTNFNDYAFFQFFASIFLAGSGIIGLLILTPLTKWFFKFLRSYFQWNISVLRGGA